MKVLLVEDVFIGMSVSEDYNMSWYCQHLLMNSEILHAQPDFEDDEYNNLLVVESKVNFLVENGLIQKQELDVLNLLTSGKRFKDIEGILNLNRVTISKVFREVCKKISFSLGGVFTDDGYINYMVEKYKLNSDEAEKLEKYIQSNLKHKIIRSATNEY